MDIRNFYTDFFKREQALVGLHEPGPSDTANDHDEADEQGQDTDDSFRLSESEDSDSQHKQFNPY